MKVILEDKKIVYCAPVNNSTKAWGVYSIPRMWRAANGDLLIFINGDIDSPVNEAAPCPHLFFKSQDNGKTWNQVYDVDIREAIGWTDDSPICELENGNKICIRAKDDIQEIRNSTPIKKYLIQEGGEEMYVFRQGDLKDCFACELYTFDKDGVLLKKEDCNIDFPEREIITYGRVRINGELVEQVPKLRSVVLGTSYVYSINKLFDGTLIGLCCGQCEEVSDRFCGNLYLVESTDNGTNWKKRSVITTDSKDYKFGLLGDGGEASMTIDDDGKIYCLTRTDMSFNHMLIGGTTDAMLFTSSDNGYTWTKGLSVSDSSVTPHVISLKNGAIVVIYGRPGVHIKVSLDKGKTFSSETTVIGKTLTNALNGGQDYLTVKYFDMDSYCNTFIEKISDNSFLLLYTDMKYDNGDGEKHKATIVVKVTIEL